MSKEELIKKPNNAVATNMFEADANMGMDKMTQEDLALPFLKILGQLSPEVNKRDGKYVEGAEPGMIYNSVTGEVFNGEKGVNVIPCYYKLEYVEWKDRGKDGSGAPVNIYPSSSDILSKTTRGADFKDRLPNGNYIEKTAQHFVIVSGNSPATALIAMKSTQLKTSRTWNSMIQQIKLKGKDGKLFTPAAFSHQYHLKTVQQSNDKGTWFGWDVARVGPISDPGIYKIAKDFGANVSKGEVKVKHGEQESKSDSPY